jgi:VanZ family protein
MNRLKYEPLWLFVGLSMVIFVVYSSLTSDPMNVDMGFEWQDKVLHTIAYFGLMGWFIQIFHQQKTRYVLAVVFIAMGISLEFLQDFGGVRYFEVSDMFANTLGVLLAWSLVMTPFPKLLSWFESKLFAN